MQNMQRAVARVTKYRVVSFGGVRATGAPSPAWFLTREQARDEPSVSPFEQPFVATIATVLLADPSVPLKSPSKTNEGRSAGAKPMPVNSLSNRVGPLKSCSRRK